MKKVSDLTYKMIVFNHVDIFDVNEAVDWAYEMLELGYEAPNLLMLAGVTKPANFFETKPYLEAALQELRLPQLTGENVTISYAYPAVKSIASFKDIKQNVDLLYRYFISLGYDSDIYDFAELHWAWEDLKYDDIQYYIPDLTRENYESICVDTAKRWLEDNRLVLGLISKQIGIDELQ